MKRLICSLIILITILGLSVFASFNMQMVTAVAKELKEVVKIKHTEHLEIENADLKLLAIANQLARLKKEAKNEAMPIFKKKQAIVAKIEKRHKIKYSDYSRAGNTLTLKKVTTKAKAAKKKPEPKKVEKPKEVKEVEKP